MACLALWVYEDAKVKSQQSPLLWVLVALLVPNLIGLIIYLLVGRTNKHMSSPGRYKRLAIASALCFALGTGIFIGGIVNFANADMLGTYGARQIGSFAGYDDILRNGVWTISAERANGYSRRTPALRGVEMDVFHVISTGDGNISLRIEQERHIETIDISNSFDGHIDLHRFEPGRIGITVEFDQAEDVNITIRWR